VLKRPRDGFFGDWADGRIVHFIFHEHAITAAVDFAGAITTNAVALNRSPALSEKERGRRGGGGARVGCRRFRCRF